MVILGIRSWALCSRRIWALRWACLSIRFKTDKIKSGQTWKTYFTAFIFIFSYLNLDYKSEYVAVILAVLPLLKFNHVNLFVFNISMMLKIPIEANVQCQSNSFLILVSQCNQFKF